MKLGQEPAFFEFDSNLEGYGDCIRIAIRGDVEYIPFKRGMNKRFYAACVAMQGLISNPNISRPGTSVVSTIEEQYTQFSKICFEYADALLKQENDEQQTT